MHWLTYVLLTPAMVCFAALTIYPTALTVPLVFKDYKLMKGIWGSPWAGLQNIEVMVRSPDFYPVIRNTVLISLYRLGLGFFPPIILAILTYDLRIGVVRRVSQSLTYLPYFLSWVVMYGIVLALMNPSDGVLIMLLRNLGLDPPDPYIEPAYFRSMLVVTHVWKTVGWGTIIYLAALAGIEPELFEAATVDGADWYHRIWYITLPGIRPVIALLVILQLATILNAGFEQVYLFYSPIVYSVGDIIDTWVYRRGLLSAEYGVATAVGFFKSVIGFILIMGGNAISKWLSGRSFW